jgi:hypothetical protein
VEEGNEVEAVKEAGGPAGESRGCRLHREANHRVAKNHRVANHRVAKNHRVANHRVADALNTGWQLITGWQRLITGLS